MPAAAELVELRVLDGPNLYFTRPSVKVTVAVEGWLGMSGERLSALADRLEASVARAGPPGSGQRLRAVARIAGHVARVLGRASGRRFAVRSRPGPGRGEVVVAFPWGRRNRGEAVGRELAGLLEALPSARSPSRLLAEAGARVRAVDPGPAPDVPVPSIPVIAVTGTNGKTTTVRLIDHLFRAAGRSVAISTTDGVYHDARLVEDGDYSGFAGAGMALAQPGVEVAVLETARGGILLRGMGTTHNDVAVVTNVSADHLGLLGIETLDQLAEVKAAITRITRPEGWVVLNADDPRVLAMHRVARGRPFLFSMDPDHPAIRSVAAEGGRAITLLDARLALVGRGMRVRTLLPIEEVPVSLAGISSPNVQNAMAAAAAALGIGLSAQRVAEGLRSFVPGPEANPGRANLFEIDGRVVVLDYAHNEAGMEGLVEIARGLRPPGGEIWLALGCAGDRSDGIMRGMGYIAARGAEHVAISELHRYLRGREPQDVVELLRAGALDGGADEVPVFPDELGALERMLGRSGPGDVIALTALGQRPELFALLEGRGAEQASPRRVLALARAARGG